MLAATVFALPLGVTAAVAQDTTSTVSQTVVTPGHATTVLVTGVPGHYYAVNRERRPFGAGSGRSQRPGGCRRSGGSGGCDRSCGC